jgi:hypothetical protein
MTTNKKISAEDIKKCFGAGLGVRETARQLGCTPGAISKRSKTLGLNVKINIAKDIVLFQAGDIVTKELDAVSQLQKINHYANSLLDLLMRWNAGDSEALQVLEGQVGSRKVKVGRGVKFIDKLKVKDPRELAFIAMREIREQLKLQFEMMRGLYDMKQIAAFQDEILTAIGEVEPDVRKRIVENLQRRRVIRSATKCD